MRPSGGLLDRLSGALGSHVRPQEVREQGAALGEPAMPHMRPISRGDFAFALGHVRPTGDARVSCLSTFLSVLSLVHTGTWRVRVVSQHGVVDVAQGSGWRKSRWRN